MSLLVGHDQLTKMLQAVPNDYCATQTQVRSQRVKITELKEALPWALEDISRPWRDGSGSPGGRESSVVG